MVRDHNGPNVDWLSDCLKFNYHQLLLHSDIPAIPSHWWISLSRSPSFVSSIKNRNQNSHDNDDDDHHHDSKANDTAHHHDPANDER